MTGRQAGGNADGSIKNETGAAQSGSLLFSLSNTEMTKDLLEESVSLIANFKTESSGEEGST